MYMSHRKHRRNLIYSCALGAAMAVVAFSADAQQSEAADPLSTLLAESEGVGELAKALTEDDGTPNAVSENDLGEARETYRKYGAFMTDTFTTPPKDADELLDRMESLATIYQHFVDYENPAGWVFADTAKAFALAEEQHWIACRLDDRDILKRLKEINKRLRVDPSKLAALAKGADRANDRKDPEEHGDVADWPRKKYMEEVGEAADRIWESHGFSSFTKVYPGLSAMLPSPYPALLTQGEEAKLAYLVFVTDSRLMTIAGGTIEFLERGGDVDQVDTHDVRYFKSVMPSRDKMEYGYPVIGIRSFNSAHIRNWLDIECAGDGPEQQPPGERSRAVHPVLKYLVGGSKEQLFEELGAEPPPDKE